MKADIKFYTFTGIVFVAAILANLLLTIPESIRTFINLPGILAFLAIINEAWRDKRAYDRQLDILSRTQDNTLAITSHMAIVVFDRQVNFCEVYFEKAYEILLELFASGPTKTALSYATELSRIRMRYSPWISPQIEKGLLPFENAIREIGINAQIIEMNLPKPQSEIFIKKMYDTFSNVIGISEPQEGNSPEEATLSIIKHLRKVLGIENLTNLRDQVIQSATIRSNVSKK